MYIVGKDIGSVTTCLNANRGTYYGVDIQIRTDDSPDNYQPFRTMTVDEAKDIQILVHGVVSQYFDNKNNKWESST